MVGDFKRITYKIIEKKNVAFDETLNLARSQLLVCTTDN